MKKESQNKIREVLDFAQNEIESTDDLYEMIKECSFDEIRQLALLGINLTAAVQRVDWVRKLNPDFLIEKAGQ